jgi:hypothetical protein
MKHLMKLTAATALIASLGGCVIVDAEVERDWDSGHGKAGLVYAAEVGLRAPEVTVTVHSNGCTQREHFRADVKRHGQPDSYTVTFHRVQEDFCKALVLDGVRLTWTYAELGLPQDAQVIVGNRVGR